MVNVFCWSLVEHGRVDSGRARKVARTREDCGHGAIQRESIGIGTSVSHA